jgi:hypothetical protein
MSNKRLGQTDIVIPALRIVGENPGISTSELRVKLEQIMPLSDEDKKISQTRGDSMFSQIVRNLTAPERKTKFFMYTNITSKKSGENCFSINEKGENVLNSLDIEKEEEEILDFKFQNKVNKSKICSTEELDGLDNRKPQLNSSSSQRYTTHARVSKTVLALCDYKCEIDEKHISFIAAIDNPYMEGHHLIPMKAQDDFGSVNIDCSDNICCLCPNCHKAIHLGNKDEKTQRLLHLYNKKIERLENKRIEISFDKLLYKYYI